MTPPEAGWSDAVRARLSDLHDAYVAAVNAAVGESRGDLVDRLVDSYPDAALEIMTTPR